MESRDDPPKSYQWFEPKWSYQPRTKTELCQILEIKMWLRIVIVAAVIVAPVAYIVKRFVPIVEFGWLKALTISMGAVICYMAAVTVILWFVPPTIKIWYKGIMRQQGSSYRIMLRSDIRQIIIDATNPSQPWLRVAIGKRPFECGIVDKISPTDLAQWLRDSFPEILVSEKW